MLAALLLMPRATAQIYYGSEIGMVTTTPEFREDVRDPVGISQWPANKGRDGERTPMQWTASSQAGFSNNPHTWLPIPPSSRTTNVKTEEHDPDSLLNWYRSLIALRRRNPGLRDGDMVFLNTTDPNVLSFIRTAPAGGKPVLVAINMSSHAATFLPDLHDAGIRTGKPKTLLSSVPPQLSSVAASPSLAPFQVWIASVE